MNSPTLFATPVNCHVSRTYTLIDYSTMNEFGLAAWHQHYRSEGNQGECLAIEDAVKTHRKNIYLLERLTGWKPFSSKEFFR